MSRTEAASFEVMPGLPPYGPPARPFPPASTAVFSEGVVVRFFRADGTHWTGNFGRGFTRYNDVQMHPDGRRVIVVSCGDGYLIDPEDETHFETLPGSLEALIWTPDRETLILNDQGLRLAVLSADGSSRYTRRFSWDGLAEITTDGESVRGLAFEPFQETWQPFSVALDTLEVDGGTYSDAMFDTPRRWWQFWKR